MLPKSRAKVNLDFKKRSMGRKDMPFTDKYSAYSCIAKELVQNLDNRLRY